MSSRKNLSYENEFDLHENEPVGETRSHMNTFARRLVFTLRQKAVRKWLIGEAVFKAASWRSNIDLLIVGFVF